MDELAQNTSAPILSINTSAEQAYVGDEYHQQTKARFTRAQKRQFAKQKKAAQQTQLEKQPHTHKKDLKVHHKPRPSNCNDIDDVIAYLVSIRTKAGARNLRQSMTQATKTYALESRITKATPKKELTAKQIEKKQKRNEVRVEKRKTRHEKKAAAKKAIADEGTKMNDAEGTVTKVAPAALQQPLPDFDDIRFDEL